MYQRSQKDLDQRYYEGIKLFLLKSFQSSTKDFRKELFEDLLQKINADHLKIFRKKYFNTKSS